MTPTCCAPGGTPRVFGEVYAPSTLGIFLREFTFGHANQLAAVAREHLIALAARTGMLAGRGERMFVDIDSLLRPVYGHQKQGASFGHAKIAGRALLRKGLSPLVTTLSTAATAAPVIAEAWLRGGKTGSGRGAARQLKQAITTATAIDPHATLMVRGDSAFGTKKVIGACLDEQAEFSLTLGRNRRVTRAMEAIDDAAFTPVHYPGAVIDPDTGQLISDAEVAETPYTLTCEAMGASPPGWWCAGSKTPATPTRCSRSGATTRSSPTPSCPPPRPTSPTADTPSSKPPSPTSSTDRWLISPVDSTDFTTVSDAKSYAALKNSDAPALHVQIEADRIAREEQAHVYQQRLQRMETAIENTETAYAQRIRQLAVRFE